MLKIFSTLFILILLITVSCKQSKDIGTSGFYEPEDPESASQETWNSIKPGLHANFGSTDIRYSRSVPPEIVHSGNMKKTGWKGEKLNFQAILWSTGNIATLEISSTDLTSKKGLVIGTPYIRVRPVGYLLTDEFLTGCGHRNKDTIPAHLVPDILYSNQIFNLPAQSVRPVWLSIQIPVKVPAGTYSGALQIMTPKDTLQLPYSVIVQDWKLPTPTKWKFHLDLWQNPFAVARYHNVPLWSQAHWDLLEPLLSLLADAGQKCITTSIIPRPWGGQTYDPFGSMIEWIHNSSGKWEFDYSVFDQYVEMAMRCGITEQINCYTMVPWGNRFSYFDEDSSSIVTGELLPGTVEYEELWSPFLYDFRAHLKEMGWLDKTTIALDERGIKEMESVISFLNETTPEIKITMAGHYFPEINDELYDYSYNWRQIRNDSPEVAARRRKVGLKTTYYVACGIPKPNNFTFSPPAESTYEGWFAAALGLDGFLRWAYNSWTIDPVHDSRFRTWPAGDTYFVYPGARSSIRFEKLRGGIQDYEKINLIKEYIKKNPTFSNLPDSLDIFSFLKEFTPKTLDDNTASEMVSKGRYILSNMSEYLIQNYGK